VEKKSAVLQTIEELSLDAEQKESTREPRSQQVNIRLSDYGSRLLDALSDRLDESRATVAGNLLAAAIFDSCEHIGIPTQLTPEEKRVMVADLRRRGFTNITEADL
jgi:DNA replication initiation complex subunit (GINS family)